MFALSPCLDNLLSRLPPRPISKVDLDSLVETALKESQDKASTDFRKSQWEFVLKNEVFRLAATEGSALKDPNTRYYGEMQDRLDVILTFTEHDACEQTFPFTVLQDLLETQTIASCSHIFSWIEERSERLTEGMVPQKGKALVLLRTLNDLLRRLSKTGKTTIFCGRILTFLSGVFPLGERSGVNLRGEYGPQWEGVTYKRDVKELKAKEEQMEVDGTQEKSQDAMQVDDPSAETKSGDAPAEKKEGKSPPTKPAADKTEEEKRQDFFYTFWSLQLPFSRPPLFSQASTLPSFKSAVNAVMPVIKEATVKERAMMGSKAVVGTLKRKREEPATLPSDDASRNYFFAKFLTSPELLELELSDTVFRRQFLFQLLILLNHLLQFTKSAKAKWTTNRNRSLQMDFTLEPADAKWAQETVGKAFEELKATSPNGRAFAETVQTILEREKNWVRWKNDLCSPFDKEPLSVSLEESTAPLRQKMREPPAEWPHKLGSEALTEIWEMGYRDIHDLQAPFLPGEVKDFVKDVEKENARIAFRKQQLAKQAQKLNEARARAAASKANSPAPPPAAAGSTPPILPPTPAASTTPAPASTPTPASAPAPPSTPVRTPVPAPASAASPLHPSLPAKPGSAPVVEARPVTPGTKPSPAPATVPAPAIVAPVPTPAVAAPPVAIQVPPPSVSVPVIVSPPEPTDPVIAQAEENKHRISWLALRTARDDYLHHFGKIGNGDIVLLAQEIEKEKEREKRGESAGIGGDGATGGDGVSGGDIAMGGDSAMGVDSATGAGAGAERGASPTGSGEGAGEGKEMAGAGGGREDVKMDVEEVKPLPKEGAATV
ncbi:hypothetical protein BD410DRAFT_774040 [Rickenella mellea]|uniref:THO complex subunit 1 transcription elongation factor-domain-containing protein n=1 Tax=Rickenella mellea TaxID=50990 RepID=A0A4Y7PVG6_9AGAM|nr:hypothetical protein BD410DRAFT_774040 [Rickenella mellea]